jgi:hypothetical protein
MATPKQIAANRRNSQKSTGPRSPEGKARPSPTRADSFKPHIGNPAYQELLFYFLEEFTPLGTTPTELVADVAKAAWRLHSLRDTEVRYMIKHGLRWPAPDLLSLSCYEAIALREFFEAVHRLERARESNLHKPTQFQGTIQ